MLTQVYILIPLNNSSLFKVNNSNNLYHSSNRENSFIRETVEPMNSLLTTAESYRKMKEVREREKRTVVVHIDIHMEQKQNITKNKGNHQ